MIYVELKCAVAQSSQNVTEHARIHEEPEGQTAPSGIGPELFAQMGSIPLSLRSSPNLRPRGRLQRHRRGLLKAVRP